MSKAQDIVAYGFSNTDKLFLDANIWIYIYGPQGSPTDLRSSTYSRALSNAMLAHSQVVVDVLIISEFINRFARLEHQRLCSSGQSPKDYKQFRNSPSFQPVAQAIVSAVRKIVKITTRCESGFTLVDIDVLLTEFEAGKHDFNDQILTNLCQSQSLKFVTHDTDFKGKDLNILTANRQILV